MLDPESSRRLYADLLAVRAHLENGDQERATSIWKQIKPNRDLPGLRSLVPLVEGQLAGVSGDVNRARELAETALEHAELEHLPRQRLEGLMLIEELDGGRGYEWLREEARRLDCHPQLMRIEATKP